MYAAWEEEFAASTAIKYARMGITILENLSLRGSSWPETCIEAIKGMESALTQTPNGVQFNIPPTPNGPERPAPTSNFIGRRMSQLSPVQDRTHEVGDTNLTPVRPQNPQTSAYQERPASMGIKPFDSSVRSTAGLGPVENYDSANFSPLDNMGNFAEVLDPTGNNFNGQSSAELIFGSTADNNGVFNPSFAGQDSLPLTSSMFMNDLWSVADGPWMIHNNFL
jgi:hypothetical protein